jgi:hypothetical protein
LNNGPDAVHGYHYPGLLHRVGLSNTPMVFRLVAGSRNHPQPTHAIAQSHLCAVLLCPAAS